MVVLTEQGLKKNLIFYLTDILDLEQDTLTQEQINLINKMICWISNFEEI